MGRLTVAVSENFLLVASGILQSITENWHHREVSVLVNLSCERKNRTRPPISLEIDGMERIADNAAK
jgi:hypothetical protein